MGVPNLSHRLELQTPERAPDGCGGHITTWTTVGTVWAEIHAGRGRERIRAALTFSTVPCRIIVRAAPVGSLARPRPEQRFRVGNQAFRIMSVADSDVSSRYLTCMAEEEAVS
ncbi:phage head closure protein [Actibacterium sp. 188UL27-1]|uniref:phage head closure protein n=1 Tax=Actibacterium sp. 188UL27-1 TaxID=2786961 RepID=UPI0019594A1A|nr:phage head closure protein [Actibacterium sp. 188UL27-1]MBM7068037.1 phage head closure protein [Actibacterium sp. 188UL27-1]